LQASLIEDSTLEFIYGIQIVA